MWVVSYESTKEVLGDKKRITDEDLLYVTKESVDLLKKELTQPGRTWEDDYEPVALEKQVPKDRVTFYHLKDNVLTNCQLEDVNSYGMGIEFTIQDTSEYFEEAA